MLFDFADMIQYFGTPLEIKIKSGNENGHYEAGEWVASTDITSIKVNEPLVPPRSIYAPNTQQPQGQQVVYDLDWYSEHTDIPMGTLVTDLKTKREYSVQGIIDYADYAGITIYHMKRVEV